MSTPITSIYDTKEEALEAASHDFGRTMRKRPKTVAHPNSAQDVGEIIRTANRRGTSVTFQGAGHSQSGLALSDDGILIDMKGLNGIGDIEDGEIRVEAGARWKDVVYRVAPRGYLPPALPTHLTVTVGGTLSVGGLSITSHRYGAQADNVSEMEVVTGSGELLYCSLEKNADLFNSVRCGLGQFGAITKARVRLRKALSNVRTYALVYEHVEDMMQDFEIITGAQRFQYIDGWCLPIVRDMWQMMSGNLYAHRIFWVYLSVEWEEQPPNQIDLLGDLHYSRLVKYIDASTLDFVTRMETQHLSASPKNFDWRRRTSEKVENIQQKGWFNDWNQSHPCTEGLLPWDAFPQFITEVVSELPPPVARAARIMLSPFRTDNFKAPLLARPKGEMMMGYGILLEAPSWEMDEILPILATESRRIIEAGGKRYLSGWLDFDHQGWQEHYGELWPLMLNAKLQYDPDRTLNPEGIPLYP